MRNNLKFITRGILFVITMLVMIGLGAEMTGAVAFAMAPTFGDLDFDDGEDNQAGTQLLAYYALASDVTQLPSYSESESIMDDLGQIVGSFTMKNNAVFKPLYASPASGKIDDNTIEGADQNGTESTYEFIYPKMSPKAIGFSRMARTSKFIVVVLDNNGQKRVLGSKKGLPATLASVTGTTDVTSGGAPGQTFQFKSFQNGPAPVFTGSIPLDDSESV